MGRTGTYLIWLLSNRKLLRVSVINNTTELFIHDRFKACFKTLFLRRIDFTFLKFIVTDPYYFKTFMYVCMLYRYILDHMC
jgi:hypothetical protein